MAEQTPDNELIRLDVEPPASLKLPATWRLMRKARPYTYQIQFTSHSVRHQTMTYRVGRFYKPLNELNSSRRPLDET